jgi:NADH:ubiquinone oxidoreductase subunit C
MFVYFLLVFFVFLLFLNIFFNFLPNIFLILKKYNTINIFSKHTLIYLYIYKSLSFLKYSMFINLFVTDAPTNIRRFTINYIVQSFKNISYLNFINQINELTSIKSINSIFLGASWPEREA